MEQHTRSHGPTPLSCTLFDSLKKAYRSFGSHWDKQAAVQARLLGWDKAVVTPGLLPKKCLRNTVLPEDGFGDFYTAYVPYVEGDEKVERTTATYTEITKKDLVCALRVALVRYLSDRYATAYTYIEPEALMSPTTYSINLASSVLREHIQCATLAFLMRYTAQ